MKNKNFIIIVVGQIISLFGNAIQRFSMSLYLLEFTGSTAVFANILAISTIPYILFAPIAGMLSDNVNRKKIMVYLDFFCLILIGGYAIILFSGKDNQFIVAVVMFILSICYTLYGPAVTASIPQVVEEDKLTSANGVISQVGSVVNFLGPIFAGILYGIFGIKIIVIVNAISFLFSAIMELFLEIPDVIPSHNLDKNESAKKNSKITIEKLENNDLNKEDTIILSKEDSDKKSIGRTIVEDGGKSNIFSMKFVKNSFIDMYKTFKYLAKEKKVVLWIISSYALCNIFLVPILSIFAPYFINIYLGLPSQIYGIVEGIFVLGMIIGGFWISVKPNAFKIKKVHYTYFPMLAGVIIMSFLGILKVNNYALATIFALSGMLIMLSLSLSNVLTLTFIQKEIKLEMLGKVSAFSTAIATISVAPGQLLYGQIMDSGIPIGIVLLMTAIANFLLIIFVKWSVRSLNHLG